MLFSTEWWKQVYFRILEKKLYHWTIFSQALSCCNFKFTRWQIRGKYKMNSMTRCWKQDPDWLEAGTLLELLYKLHIRKEVNIKTLSKRKLSLHKESNTSWNQLELFSWRKLYNKFRLIMCFYLICFNMSCTYMMGVNNWQDKRKSTQTEPL